MWSFNHGLAEIKLANKYGFIDKNGNEIIPPKYDFVTDFHNGVVVVSLNKKYGFIDKSGNEIVAPKYDDVWYFNKEGIAKVKMGKK